MRRETAEWVTGAVAFTAFAGLVMAIVQYGGLNPFRGQQTIHVHFDDVAFLSPGSVVRSGGTMVGMVEDLELYDGGVLGTLKVDERVAIHEGAQPMVRSLSILGGRFVELDPGDRRRPRVVTTRAKPLRGRVEPSLFDDVSAMIDEAAPYLSSATANVNEVMEQIAEAQGTLGKLMSDPELVENIDRAATRLESSSATVRAMTRKVDEATGTLGRLLHEPRFERAFEGTRDRLASISDKLSAGEGPLGALVSDEDLGATIDRARERFTSVAGALAEEQEAWSAGGRGDRLREAFTSAIENLGRLQEKVSGGKGPLLVLMREPRAARDADRIGEHIQAIADRPRSSTIARLSGDPTLLSDLERGIYDLGFFTTGEADVPVSNTLQGAVKGRFVQPEDLLLKREGSGLSHALGFD